MHSTMTVLLNSTNSWLVNMDRGLCNIVIFIDLKKAFDTVDHEILLQKMRRFGIGDSSRLMHSYLTNQARSVVIFSSTHMYI